VHDRENVKHLSANFQRMFKCGFAVVKLNHLLIVLCIVKIYDLHSSTLLATLENPPRVSLSNSPEFLVAQCAGWCRLYSASEAPVLR